MADFPVYQPQQGGNGLDMLLNDILRRNALQQQQKNQTQDEIQRAVLGASTSDMAVYAPEELKKLQGAQSLDEANAVMARAARVAGSRKQRADAIQQNVAAYQKQAATPGLDPSAQVAQIQQQLTSPGPSGTMLTPDLIANLQAQMNAAGAAGSAERSAIMEERAAAAASRTAGIQEQKKAQREEANYELGLREAADIRSEKRQAEARLTAQYQEDARSMQLPPDTPRELVDEERTRRRLNLPADPKVFEANQKAWDAWNRDRTAKEDRTQGSIDDMIERSRELNVNATGQGASIVFGIVRDGGWLGTGFREKARVVPMGGDVARANLGQMYAAAQNGDADAKKAFSFMERLAETNPGVKRAFEDVVPKPDADRANAVLEELFNFQNTPGPAAKAAKAEPSSPRDKGRAAGEAVRGAFTRNPKGEQRSKDEIAAAEKRQREMNLGVADTAKGFVEGLTGRKPKKKK